VKTRDKYLLGASLVVPVIFLIRNFGRWAAIEEEHSASEQRFDEHVKELDAEEAAAKTFGASTDEVGCVNEAIRRTAADPSFASSSSGSSFLRGCLASCKTTAGYCDAVPAFESDATPPAEAQRAKEWRKKQCEATGQENKDFACAAQFKFAQLHCHPLK
jgi:hypothetical protein